MPRVYAYVKSASCQPGRAVLPGEYVDGQTPVSSHRDYWQWTDGKRKTLALARDPLVSAWRRAAAVAVARRLGWMR